MYGSCRKHKTYFHKCFLMYESTKNTLGNKSCFTVSSTRPSSCPGGCPGSCPSSWFQYEADIFYFYVGIFFRI